jgi:hypothetical protein
MFSTKPSVACTYFHTALAMSSFVLSVEFSAESSTVAVPEPIESLFEPLIRGAEDSFLLANRPSLRMMAPSLRVSMRVDWTPGFELNLASSASDSSRGSIMVGFGGAIGRVKEGSTHSRALKKGNPCLIGGQSLGLAALRIHCPLD